jgi:F0F1-type ATP synthase assembly protein I
MPFNRPIPDSKTRSKSSSVFASYVQAEKLMQIALVMPCAVLIGWGCGVWLDSRLHQSWIALAGIALGSIAGLTSAIRLAMAAGADSKTESKTGNGTEKGSSGRES